VPPSNIPLLQDFKQAERISTNCCPTGRHCIQPSKRL
jgi:hypothetical protein